MGSAFISVNICDCTSHTTYTDTFYESYKITIYLRVRLGRSGTLIVPVTITL